MTPVETSRSKTWSVSASAARSGSSLRSSSDVARPRPGTAESARGDLVVFCDDDVVVETDHVRLHLEKQSLRPRALVNGVSEVAAVLNELSSTPFGRYRIALERRFEAGRTVRLSTVSAAKRGS